MKTYWLDRIGEKTNTGRQPPVHLTMLDSTNMELIAAAIQPADATGRLVG
jgi:hypothetical protein